MYNYPSRPIKSFQDLEVYQKALAVSVAVVKRINPEENINDLKIIILLHETVLSLPVLIATAHSLRFSDPTKAINLLEETMLNCNLSVVYLEQFRDIINKDIEPDFFAEQIKTLLSSRIKIMHLQMSWKKFNQIPKTYEK